MRWERRCYNIPPVPKNHSAVGWGSRHPPQLRVSLPQEGFTHAWTGQGGFPRLALGSDRCVPLPCSLMSSRRYYFELLHKQDDRGSDHVEVGVSKCPPSSMPASFQDQRASARAFPCVFKRFILEQSHGFPLPWLPMGTNQCHCFPGYSRLFQHGVLFFFPAGLWAAEDPGQEKSRAGRSRLAGCIPAVGERWLR